MKRRDFLGMALSGAALSSLAPLALAQSGAPRVVVAGGGFAGATCAKYLRRWSPTTQVTLVEANAEFVSCPMSNRVIGGTLGIRDLTRGYDTLAAHGVEVLRGRVAAIDPEARQVRLADGAVLPYDRLVVAPGIDFAYETMPGFESAAARETMPHAWRAGAQTRDLRHRVMTLPEGGVFAMHIPRAPFRCPPGPYERACLVANAIKRGRSGGKVLVFDANPDILAKKDLFQRAFRDEYADIIEYIPNAGFDEADTGAGVVGFDLHGRVPADVWNVIPPQRAGALARDAGLANIDQRWCEVDFLSYESRVVPGIHVIGDAVASAPGLPKSAHMANQQAKVCAGAIASMFADRAPGEDPIIANTCYSFVNEKDAVHIAGVYRYDAARSTMVPVDGAGGLSAAPSSEEGFLAVAWVFNILNDTLV